MTGRRVRLPLEGVRVTDITVVLAGTNAATLLADWGAEVIRVEPLHVVQPSTRGMFAHPTKEYIDATRHWVSAYPNWDPGPRPWNRWNFFNSHGRNKLSMTVDLSKPEGQQFTRRLIALSDVFIENNVPDTFEKWDLDYERLRRIKPDLIMVRMPAYGLTGPYRTYRSFGSHIEGASGHTYLRGYHDTDPTETEDVYFGDASAAVAAAFAVATALHQLRRTGKGQLIELAQTENVVNYFGELLLDYQMNGRIAGHAENDLGAMAPHNTYPCAGDDRWIAIAVGNDEAWQGLVRVMGNPSWAAEQRFTGQPQRYENRRELDSLVGEWTGQHEGRWLMERLQAAGVPAGVVNDDRDAFEDRHLNVRGFFETLRHPEVGVHRYPGIIWKMARTPNAIRFPPALLGQHNPYVYRELFGVSSEEYTRLEAEGHIGADYPDHLP
ncbi:MAG: CoA transferase [Dehalococcoidia bacterium]